MITTSAPSTALSFHAIPPSELTRIRAAGVDDFGHPLRIMVNESPDGTPLRCCLREAAVGEEVVLIAWRPLIEAPHSVYAEVGPIFIHADACSGCKDDVSYPEGFRHRQQVLRSYTAAGDMHATTIAAGDSAEAAIAELLADPEAAVVHSRNIEPGCYMFAIRRRDVTAA